MSCKFFITFFSSLKIVIFSVFSKDFAEFPLKLNTEEIAQPASENSDEEYEKDEIQKR